VNVGGLRTTGIDGTVAYSMRLGGLGQLSTGFSGTRLLKYITDNGLTTPYDCAGYYGAVCSSGTVSSSSPLPKWRHKLRTTLQTPMGLGVSVQWRHLSKVRHERLGDNIAAGNPPVLGRTIKAYNYIDLAATMTLLERVNLRAGVNNLFDKTPPLITSSAGSCPSGPCSGNTYPGMYDALGRYGYLGATVDFLPPKRRVEALAPVLPPAPAPVAPATQTCQDGSVILATDACPVPPPPPAPPAPAPERG
jgi:outer membrane receptor protein involved in Fe transport